MKILKFGIVLAIVGLFITATKAQRSSGGGCLNADILFILDWSSSVEGEEQNTVSAVRLHVQDPDLHFSRFGIKMGIMTFDVDAYVRAELTDDKKILNKVLNRLDSVPANGWNTLLLPPLKKAESVFEASALEREQFPVQIIVFISDGEASDFADAIKQAKKLKDSGVRIFCVGVGKKLTVTTASYLKDIASENCYLQTTYVDLRQTLKQMDLCP